MFIVSVAVIVAIAFVGLVSLLLALSRSADTRSAPPAAVDLGQGAWSVVLVDCDCHVIDAIKTIRERVPGLGLKECKDLVEAAPIVVVRGVSKEYAERLQGALATAGAVAVVREDAGQAGFGATPAPVGGEVTLVSAGVRKISVIKVLREMFPMGLAEAKELVERAPVVLPRAAGVSAGEVRARLEAVGAKVTIAGLAAETPPVEPVAAVRVPQPVAAKSVASPPVTAKPVVGLVDLVLVNPGPNAIPVRQALKKVLGMDLLEAYEAVEKTPSVLRIGITSAEASGLKAALEAEGAEIQIRPSGSQL